jgi:hypothetical protein
MSVTQVVRLQPRHRAFASLRTGAPASKPPHALRTGDVPASAPPLNCPKQNKASLQMSSIWPPANRNG